MTSVMVVFMLTHHGVRSYQAFGVLVLVDLGDDILVAVDVVFTDPSQSIASIIIIDHLDELLEQNLITNLDRPHAFVCQ